MRIIIFILLIILVSCNNNLDNKSIVYQLGTTKDDKVFIESFKYCIRRGTDYEREVAALIGLQCTYERRDPKISYEAYFKVFKLMISAYKQEERNDIKQSFRLSLAHFYRYFKMKKYKPKEINDLWNEVNIIDNETTQTMKTALYIENMVQNDWEEVVLNELEE